MLRPTSNRVCVASATLSNSCCRVGPSSGWTVRSAQRVSYGLLDASMPVSEFEHLEALAVVVVDTVFVDFSDRLARDLFVGMRRDASPPATRLPRRGVRTTGCEHSSAERPRCSRAHRDHERPRRPRAAAASARARVLESFGCFGISSSATTSRLTRRCRLDRPGRSTVVEAAGGALEQRSALPSATSQTATSRTATSRTATSRTATSAQRSAASQAVRCRAGMRRDLHAGPAGSRVAWRAVVAVAGRARVGVRGGAGPDHTGDRPARWCTRADRGPRCDRARDRRGVGPTGRALADWPGPLSGH